MPNQVTDEELLGALEELADELGRTPTQNDVAAHTPHSKSTYFRRFGSFTVACEEAGLEPNGKWHEAARHVQDAIGDAITGFDDPDASRGQ